MADTVRRRTPEAFPEHLLGLLHVPPEDDRRCTAEDTFVSGWYAALDAVRVLIRQEDTKALIREMTPAAHPPRTETAE